MSDALNSTNDAVEQTATGTTAANNGGQTFNQSNALDTIDQQMTVEHAAALGRAAHAKEMQSRNEAINVAEETFAPRPVDKFSVNDEAIFKPVNRTGIDPSMIFDDDLPTLPRERFDGGGVVLGAEDLDAPQAPQHEVDVDGETLRLPLFDFATPPVVTLPNGVSCQFKIPDSVSDQRKEDFSKTVVTTSPGKVNGQNPRHSVTDYTKGQLQYFKDIAQAVKGYEINGRVIEEFTSVNAVVDRQQTADGEKTVKLLDVIPNHHKRAFSERLYGGKIELEGSRRAKDIDELEADEIDAALTEEPAARAYTLRTQQIFVVRHELGIEQKSDGTFTKPTHVVRYFFKEPEGEHHSIWETKVFKGQTIPLNGGGSKETRFYNLQATTKLFDALIQRVEGASVAGREFDPSIKAHLASIPDSVKKNIVAVLMFDITNDLGNV